MRPHGAGPAADEEAQVERVLDRAGAALKTLAPTHGTRRVLAGAAAGVGLTQGEAVKLWENLLVRLQGVPPCTPDRPWHHCLS